jgi:hypothetical protein
MGETAFIFHVYRKGGESLILHPFDSGDKLFSIIETGEVQGRYGNEPRVEALTALRGELHRLADDGVARWLADVRFIPKFLMSSATFLLLYFFFSFVVRDPLPIIDEAVVGIGGAVILFVLLGRADLRSTRATQRRSDLRAAVDRVTFTESGFVRSVEQALAEGESGSLLEWTETMTRAAGWSALDNANAAEARSFVSTVGSHFGLRRGRGVERSLKRLLRRRGTSRERLDRWARARKIDVPLFAVYNRIKRSVVTGSSV